MFLDGLFTRMVIAPIGSPFQAMKAHLNSIEVDDIDKTAEAINNSGGRVVIPKWEIPGYG
jgi:predicted enzyme related to lactoylglutathione lyase